MLNPTEVDDFLNQTDEKPFTVWFEKSGNIIRKMVCTYAGPSKIATNLAIVKEGDAFKSFHTDCVICMKQGKKIIGKEPS